MCSLLRGAFFALVEDSRSGHFFVPDDPFRAAGGEAEAWRELAERLP
ncbi:hypothetical protein NRF20_14780 [Streptomyces sp. R-74717]